MDNKTRILSLLKEHADRWLSGEELSDTLGLSRTAVWKYVQTLRGEGYAIESSTKKGYLLTERPDVLSIAEVGDILNTKVFGVAGYHYLQETGSTNHEAAVLADQGAPEGTIVIAERQTRGRGRRERNWYSPAGKNIYFSLILRPSISPAQAPKLTLLAAVAAAETLSVLTGLDVRIKWPNDLLVGDRKIAGILTEMSAGMEAVNHVIMGIGLNINTPPESFPDEIRDIATSLRAETGGDFPRALVLGTLLESLELYYHLFLSGGFPNILVRWKELSGIVGKKIQVNGVNSRVAGTVLDVDGDGVLLLKDDEGLVHRIFSGDVILPRR
ncbi:MAG TPA: biotin--[acetyl-CoA-carboxylase] ligase [Spirochaetes bacterium]|nr:biotin--[acetyl-CoA-carboxylase] ligase [Spirochaetota bacterium]